MCASPELLLKGGAGASSEAQGIGSSASELRTTFELDAGASTELLLEANAGASVEFALETVAGGAPTELLLEADAGALGGVLGQPSADAHSSIGLCAGADPSVGLSARVSGELLLKPDTFAL